MTRTQTKGLSQEEWDRILLDARDELIRLLPTAVATLKKALCGSFPSEMVKVAAAQAVLHGLGFMDIEWQDYDDDLLTGIPEGEYPAADETITPADGPAS